MTAPAEFADRLRDDEPGDVSGVGGMMEAPTDEELWGLAPDPDTDPPDDPELAGMPGELAFELLAAEAAAAPEPAERFVAGGWSRPGRTAGAAFAAGGPADAMPPGMVLAGLTARAWDSSERISDDELVGVLRAWRRLGAWVAAGELAAVAELAARRDEQVAAGADPHIAEHLTDEVAAALTLTARSADTLVNFAGALERLPATRAALWRGEIDRARARVIAEGVTGLETAHATAVETAVIGAAGRQTTGQLRAMVRRAVLAADPAAADRRSKEAAREARVETWSEPAGTAALAGRDLPPAQVLAADRRIDALARQLKAAGASLGMDALRARVYTALLLGVPLQALHSQFVPAEGVAAAGDGPGPAPGDGGAAGTGPGRVAANGAAAGSGPDGWPDDRRAGWPAFGGESSTRAGSEADSSGAGASGEYGGPGMTLPPVTGSLNLTMPVSTWLGGAAPGEVPGFGPVPAGDARALARLLAAAPGSGICLTLTGADGTAVAHGHARATTTGRRGDGQPALTVTITPLAGGTCGHQHESPGYRPSARLRQMIVIRQRTCAFPGCRRNASACDLDHTTPFDRGGRTCQCNLAALCRRHHRAKQAQGWTLTQSTPGQFTWTLPHGRTYRAGPDPYPGDSPGPGDLRGTSGLPEARRRPDTGSDP